MNSRKIGLYSWSSHGNLGDDWLASIADSYFKDPVRVHEKRSLLAWPPGSHNLKSDTYLDQDSTLCLWGGGWVAADQGNSATLIRWEKHLRNRRGPLVGLGLGLGPFESEASRQLAKGLLSRFTNPIVVRTESDRLHARGLAPAVLGGDLSFLDTRFNGVGSQYLPPEDQRSTVMSFPRYGQHWAKQRPWLTEAWYRNYVNEIFLRQSNLGAVYHVEFDGGLNGLGDNQYWRGLGMKFLSPQTIGEAADIFLHADSVYAGRLHAALLGVQLGRPTAAVAYHHKFECVAETGTPVAGLDAQPFDLPVASAANMQRISQIRERTLSSCVQALPWIGK